MSQQSLFVRNPHASQDQGPAPPVSRCTSYPILDHASLLSPHPSWLQSNACLISSASSSCHRPRNHGRASFLSGQSAPAQFHGVQMLLLPAHGSHNSPAYHDGMHRSDALLRREAPIRPGITRHVSQISCPAYYVSKAHDPCSSCRPPPALLLYLHLLFRVK